MISDRKSTDESLVGTAIGLAVGSVIGLLGGREGVAVGTMTGSVVGAMSDFWVAGIGLDFSEEAEKNLQPSNDVAEAQFEHDIAAFKAEIQELEFEGLRASGSAKTKLQARLADEKGSLEGAVDRVRQRGDVPTRT